MTIGKVQKMTDKDKGIAINLLQSALENWATCHGEMVFYKDGREDEQSISDLNEANDCDSKLKALLEFLKDS